MIPRRLGAPAGALAALLAALTACGGSGEPDQRASRSPSPAVSTPAESRAPAPGKGAKDPDDLNGDGYRDLVVPVGTGDPGNGGEQPEERLGVVYGSAKGPDPVTRTVHDRDGLGLPESLRRAGQSGDFSADRALTADLDGDGFADVVTPVAREEAKDSRVATARRVPYVTWGGPRGPRTGTAAKATPVRLPAGTGALGVESLVRGDFDGDGHHDLAGLAQNHSSVVLLYGPFSRAGAPARTDTSLPWRDGTLHADAIDPSGAPRATSLLVHLVSDGEQSGNLLFRARRGAGPGPSGTELRRGNAHAFGDFDGDGRRDVAIGDDGSRNDEPGHETESPDIGGSLTVYPGKGGEPATRRLPRAARKGDSDYGPGGFAAADPDGDGRDGILVATYEGATLLDGDRRTEVLREGPARANSRKTPAKWRHARPAGAADFDGDGKDELILHWGAGTLFGLYGEHPTHWWITEGTTSRDRAAFATTRFADRS
ncbi:FG-GAP repeat domain-containing protein [Streptomyces boncukensis]|uniref:VCBS repeat-containing protein n=1 Tax=Streptomyces boncukensis TaxID=2711219 RepID=A0A6G4X1J2_9ACTN|nr:VCBS repeat-containing protein [Streptomyces boncukensis]NGO71365.1 VCBS repeat-containing protein [Streptomyces boncukensis]